MEAGQAELTEELEQARATGPEPWGQVGGPLALMVEELVDSEEEARVTGRVLGGVCEASEFSKDCC